MTKKTDTMLDALAELLRQNVAKDGSPEVENLVQQLRKNMLADLNTAKQKQPLSHPKSDKTWVSVSDDTGEVLRIKIPRRDGPDFWDKWFLGMAAYVTTASKDPSTKVGAVVVRPDGTVASLGFNGFPRHVHDDPALYLDREEKLKRIIHAEQNALLFAKEDLIGCTIYLWPLPPCARCAGMIIQKGVKKIVSPEPNQDQLARWGQDFDIAKDMFRQANIEYITYSSTTNLDKY